MSKEMRNKEYFMVLLNVGYESISLQREEFCWVISKCWGGGVCRGKVGHKGINLDNSMHLGC